MVFRPELANERLQIKRDTNRTLENVQASSYSPLERVFINDVLSNVGATTAISGLGKINIDREGNILPEPALTGALQAALPMTISIPTHDNVSRLEFTMLINPASWNQGKTSSFQSSYTRIGYITQMWGPQQDLITSNGKTAAFMVEGIGLTNSARRRSLAHANFLAFLYAYRNNGYQLVDPVELSSKLTRVIGKIQGIEIFYDKNSFMGHFNNFTIDENADTPFLFNYNFEFVISSLSNNYDEVRGHFEPMPPRADQGLPGIRILNDVKKTSEGT